MSNPPVAKPTLSVGTLGWWGVGLFLVMMTIGSFAMGDILGGILTLLAVGVALPPVRSQLPVKLTGGASAVVVIGLFLLASAVHSPQRMPASDTPVPTPVATALELQAFEWRREYSHLIARGQVKNVSGGRLENVEAVVTFLDKAGRYITHDSALVEYQVMLPDQTSPYEVITSNNPAAETARVEFKLLNGDLLQHRDGRK